MDKCINIRRFMEMLFDDPQTVRQASEIGQAILAARSLRLTDLSVKMKGKPAASYKRIQRFLKGNDTCEALWRLFQEQAELVIGDPTEIERPQAWKTSYVGVLKDGKTQGFWALLLATPFRGRAIPCGLITYSSRTIAEQADSRNLNHARAFASLKELVGERPLVLDQELTLTALRRALQTDQPEIHHSDQGVQYAAYDYIDLLKVQDIQISMAAVGKAEEHDYAERLMRTIKEEEVDLSEYLDFMDALEQIGHFIDEVYMTKRIHSSLGYLTPNEFETAWRTSHSVEASP